MRSPDWDTLRDVVRRPWARLRRAPTRRLRHSTPRPDDDGAAGAQARGCWREGSHDDAAGELPYAVYTPPGLEPGAPLLVMLHGCRQDPADLAAGTGVNLLADRHGFVVLYPQQVVQHNPRRCWNWFRPGDQTRGSGEPAIISAIVDRIATAVGSDRRRVYVAGMSAGGAMASVLATTYPDRFAAVGVHSGVAFGLATDPRAALAVMRDVDPQPSRPEARAALAVMGDGARPVPTVVVHGSADRTVVAANGERVTRQWMLVNRLASGGSYRAEFDDPDHEDRWPVTDGHDVVVRQWTHRLRVMQEHWHVDGLGHAWSGGSMEGSYTDPRGPSATAAMWNFLARHRLPVT